MGEMPAEGVEGPGALFVNKSRLFLPLGVTRVWIPFETTAAACAPALPLECK
jgi:hypothetical protein